jgi:hypothetical protein
MTIYWQPNPDNDNPDSIDVWHVADDGTTSGPVTADVSDIEGMPDTMGGIAPDAVRQRVGEFIRNDMGLGTDTPEFTPLGGQVILDLLELDYEQGTPPSQ